MDSDDGLMLNISAPNLDESLTRKSENRHKNKISNWKERKLQRKQVPVSIHKDKSKKGAEETRASQVYNDDLTKIPNCEHNSSQKPQVISSLFRHNPKIPKFKSSQQSPNEDSKDGPLFSVDKFGDLPLSAHMISNLENNLKMTTLTSVQKLAIPALIGGKDVFVKSKTGSGKTLCYALPIVHSLQKMHPKIERCDGPYALVLVPTRELALQSLNLLQKLVKPCQWVVPGFVVGGEKRKSEKARLRKGINILVATPGRLLDHIEKTNCLQFDKIHWVVLDEADRLLDMGFEKEVSSILQAVKDQLSPNAAFQTVLMSATLNKGIERLVQMYLNDPKFVNEAEIQDVFQVEKVVSEDKPTTMPHQLQQFFVIVPSKMRLVTLAAFILWKYQDTRHSCKMIVFLSSRDSVDFHHSLFQSILQIDNLKLFKLHGNMSQTERTEVFKDYSSCAAGVLLCTDVAARGLDLPNVNWIIQYNTPGSAVDYIHRVGRTARIGNEGQALLFLTPSEAAYLETLAENNIRPNEILVTDVLCCLVPSTNLKSKDKKDIIRKLSQDAATDLQLKFEQFVLSSKENTKAAKQAYQSFIRSYATFPSSLKHIFHIKNLHLGHVAKAFALRDAPGGMFHQGKQQNKKKKTSKKPLIKPSKRGHPIDEHDGDKSTSGPRPKKRKKKQ
ncbi:probable ATP-dependent RNA helicase DDX31 isoform X2 [Exaiptasia diaphana]|uniref:ATP-dependent RNA helicase n=1 Tax=Exaiptasia diaphana TaxID=2652724 RepID=A0A913YLD6_EXADI|nr:probable ATP-dependent RNA helicase DDX31 isoform X2 [Exaiptasia diaphana]